MKPIRRWKQEGNPMSQFKTEIDNVVQRFFEEPFFTSNPLWNRDSDLSPALNVIEKSDSYTVEVEIPGIQSEDIEIAIENNALVIKGEKNVVTEDKDNKMHVVERKYGSFQRALTLMDNVNVDEIKAEYDNGMLYINVPKTAEAEPCRIDIKTKK